MKKFMFILLLSAGLGCQDEQNQSAKSIQLSDEEKIEHLIKSVQPLFNSLRVSASGKEGVEMVSYEIVKDVTTGEVSLLNFKAEPFFPMASREEYARIAGETYSVDCTINGKTTSKQCDGKFSCGSAIAACLDQGGCATVCKNPGSFSALHQQDIEFFTHRGASGSALEVLSALPTINLEKGRSSGSLTSVKLYTLIVD